MVPSKKHDELILLMDGRGRQIRGWRNVNLTKFVLKL